VLGESTILSVEDEKRRQGDREWNTEANVYVLQSRCTLLLLRLRGGL
jgi:hypothetical protein